MPVELLVFDQAARRCKLDLEETRGRISLILDSKSALWERLDRLFPKSLEQVRMKKIQILIDDFSRFSPDENAAFTSYFVHLNSGTIGLDCQPLQQSYWLPSLAHELTHALADGLELNSGWEEGLAQRMERDIGGAQPDLTISHLINATTLPPILETRRPLLSRESYAINALLVNYVSQEFGGWPVLRATIEAAPPECANIALDFLSLITCKGRHAVQSPYLAQKLTHDGLLRYFYMALTMNNPNSMHYKIPRWAGFAHLAEGPPATLKPMQAAVFSNPDALSSLQFASKDLEGYRVWVNSAGDFRIAPAVQAQSVPQGFESESSYSIIINLGSTSIRYAPAPEVITSD